MESDCLMATELPLGKVRKFWKWNIKRGLATKSKVSSSSETPCVSVLTA